jgi:hypothetical protein
MHRWMASKLRKRVSFTEGLDQFTVIFRHIFGHQFRFFWKEASNLGDMGCCEFVLALTLPIGSCELYIKPSPSPASSSSCVEPSPRSCSSTSESSLVSPLHESRSKDKRERSPTTKIEKKIDFKKPRPRCPLHQEWQTAGNKAATEFLTNGPIRQFLITKTKGELENLIPRIMKAADDFRDMFPNFFDSDSSLSIKLRNEERHLRFASLQLELMIPTRAQGRKFALSFYYGKILGDIKDILKSRELFVIAPNDHRKIRDYI